MASLSKQETYRLLMKEKKAKMTTTPKIDHPLAKSAIALGPASLSNCY